MQDYLFVSFFLGHRSGEKARALLLDCGLLDVAINSPFNRHAWLNDIHTGVKLRLPLQDDRLSQLLERLRNDGVSVYTRFDREYSKRELDASDWLVMRTATAGLLGGIDLGQTYSFDKACVVCGAGAQPKTPVLAELDRMGKKDIDHLLYEQYLIVSTRLADSISIAALSGTELEPVKSPRNPISSKYHWLRVVNEFPPMNLSTTGIVTENLCSSCGRAGHYQSGRAPEVPVYAKIPTDARDFNVTWEYFGNWQQVRSPMHIRPIGGGRGVIVSKRTRQLFCLLKIPRIVWIPVVSINETAKL